ncbi:MCE family protein [Amycolatopsis minnesotensis]|uniref:Virulence factor Mce-like protein n=1 Tax=Amycolatopsis minnesotensis TaxID=337894 RepID=A0ABN2RRF8_9PSEU
MKGRRETSHAAMAWRGVVGVTAGIAVIVMVVAYGSGGLRTEPTAVSDIPPQTVGVAERSTVEFRGVVVGSVESVRSDATRTRLTLRFSGDHAANIPAGVHTRVLPRTLFGDQYVDLVPPAAGATGTLDVGAPIPADTSGGTIQLYTAYKRLFDVLQAIQPAKIDTALSAVSKALAGRGARLGALVDQLHDLTDDAPALVGTFSDTLGFVADLGQQLSAVAPGGVQALKDATALSADVVRQKGNIEAVLTGGLALSGQAKQFLGDNRDRLIHLVDGAGEVVRTVHDKRHGLTEFFDSFTALVTGVKSVLSHGPPMPLDLTATFDRNAPYTAADCPRYGKLTSPTCVPAAPPPPPPALGGTSGPVGSDDETAALAKLPGVPQSQRPETQNGILALLAGPILRGTRVLMP